MKYERGERYLKLWRDKVIENKTKVKKIGKKVLC